MDIVQLLKKQSLFSELSPAQLQTVSPLFEARNHGKNDYIFNQGDPPDWFYILGTGEVRIIKHSPSGKDVIIEIIGPDEVFGGVAVINDFPYPASAQAMTASDSIRITRANLLGLIERYPQISKNALGFIGRRLQDAHDKMKDIAVERVERRIANALIKFAVRSEKGEKKSAGPMKNVPVKLALKLTRQDIAEMVGTTVETSIRVMSRLQKEKILRTAEGQITIMDMDRLSKIAESGDE
jgi:CRP-like cAMP-binding protein